MLCATRLSLRALTLTTRRNALASVSSRRRGALFLLIALRPLRLLVGRMAIEGAGRRELAELVADHVLGDQHRDKFMAVIDAKGQADELREDRRAPRPRLDDLVAPGSARFLRLFQEVAVDERPLPYRACHLRSPLLLVAPAHDVAVGRLVMARLLAPGWLGPWPYRMAAAPGGGGNRRAACGPRPTTGGAVHSRRRGRPAGRRCRRRAPSGRPCPASSRYCG